MDLGKHSDCEKTLCSKYYSARAHHSSSVRRRTRRSARSPRGSESRTLSREFWQRNYFHA
ncbi:hypothetical protein JIR23_19815 [Bradyrhizobium diazoefficiens]|nr:hypothetical protein JIR23_19815 [Bradyrhizobium diazoefficiens]